MTSFRSVTCFVGAFSPSPASPTAPPPAAAAAAGADMSGSLRGFATRGAKALISNLREGIGVFFESILVESLHFPMLAHFVRRLHPPLFAPSTCAYSSHSHWSWWPTFYSLRVTGHVHWCGPAFCREAALCHPLAYLPHTHSRSHHPDGWPRQDIPVKAGRQARPFQRNMTSPSLMRLKPRGGRLESCSGRC